MNMIKSKEEHYAAREKIMGNFITQLYNSFNTNRLKYEHTDGQEYVPCYKEFRAAKQYVFKCLSKTILSELKLLTMQDVYEIFWDGFYGYRKWMQKKLDKEAG